MTSAARNGGFSLIELIVAVAIAAMLLSGLQDMLRIGQLSREATAERTALARDARFAMQRMVESVKHTERLLLPLANNSATTFDENVREQTIPASPPQSGSVFASAVLAIAVDPNADIDANGQADADNDGDGLIDEDWPSDRHNDGKAGIRGIDDDGNGTADFFLSPSGDDDESNDLAQSEDPLNDIDDDGDGSIDEDASADMNGDGAPGIAGFDDDGDSNVDEGDVNDDDEDGVVDEDWIDVVVFYLSGSDLIERRAVPWDENTDSVVDGLDSIESILTTNVTALSFERLVPSAGQQQLIDISLTLTNSNDVSITVATQVRVGGGS